MLVISVRITLVMLYLDVFPLPMIVTITMIAPTTLVTRMMKSVFIHL
jgi:hypothetical protein